MTLLTGYLDTLPDDVLLGTAILMVGAVKVGATRGSPTWNSNITYTNLEFDGKQAPVKGLDRRIQGEPIMAGTLIEFGPTGSGLQIPKLEPGSSSADTGVTPDTLTTITPKAGGLFMVDGDYLQDVRLLYRRGILAAAGVKHYAAILFPWAFVHRYGPIQAGAAANTEATIPFEIAARLDPAGSLDVAPYKIELRESLPA